MTERWSRDQVLALAPDASSQKAAQGAAAAGKWALRGRTGTVLYGECKGSGAKPYLAAVDLTEPAYRCSCPSRKFPCKHALGLLLLWSADGVPEQPAAPQWVTEWLDGRAEHAAKSAARIEAARLEAARLEAARAETARLDAARLDAAHAEAARAGPARAEAAAADGDTADTAGGAGSGAGVGGTHLDSAPGAVGSGPGAAPATGTGFGAGAEAGRPGGDREAGAGAEVRAGTPGGLAGRVESVRHQRVAAGLAELERWLADQVRQGLAGAQEHDWGGLAKRLIDAQAPGVAGLVSRLARVRAEEGWPGRLLEEYALVNLLAIAYRRRAALPDALARSVLIRVGFPVTREEVLAGPPVRDHWDVLGRRDEVQDRLTARRVWLRGRRTGRPALVLSFAPQGQPLDASLVTGMTIDADLTYYPGAAPLRALVAARHDTVASAGVPPGKSPGEALDEVAGALAEDPWTESWPLVLTGVVPGRTSLGGLPLHPRAHDPWRLIAVSGGHPVTVAAEWTPQGLRPLTTWDDDETAVIL
ncbi:SWIM zinc finger family protein [[Actinomadura] parvosata]|uniref:SWIM zinc finger family protein n=1 Tax=[Actinomadura] parvosata TaxID=1955412 RepID=UPI00406C56B0